MSHEHGVEHVEGVEFEVVLIQDRQAFAGAQFH